MVANAALVFAPLLISGLVSSYQFSESEAVFVIATELLAGAFSAVPALWWVSKISWRGVSIVSLLALVLINLISTLLVDFTYIAILRGIEGFFSGTLLILYMVVIATCLIPSAFFPISWWCNFYLVRLAWRYFL
ncbi:hypothetical protein P4S73_10570 [Paraglaciecola sp. Hal342]